MNCPVRLACRAVLSGVILAAGLAGTGGRGSAIAAGPNLAGHWHVSYYVRCVNVGLYTPACAAAVQIKLPIITDSDVSLVAQRTLDIVSDAHGRFTFQSRIVTLEQDGKVVRRCHAYQEETGTLTGVCEMRSRGHGHIAQGKTGLLDFWMEQRTTTYRGSHTYQITRSAALDTLTPARPGCWNTPKVLSLHGVPVAPRGLTAQLSVLHSAAVAVAATGINPVDCQAANA